MSGPIKNEGSRGGRIIGHTRSGLPIYSSHPSRQYRPGAIHGMSVRPDSQRAKIFSTGSKRGLTSKRRMMAAGAALKRTGIQPTAGVVEELASKLIGTNGSTLGGDFALIRSLNLNTRVIPGQKAIRNESIKLITAILKGKRGIFI